MAAVKYILQNTLKENIQTSIKTFYISPPITLKMYILKSLLNFQTYRKIVSFFTFQYFPVRYEYVLFHASSYTLGSSTIPICTLFLLFVP